LPWFLTQCAASLHTLCFWQIAIERGKFGEWGKDSEDILEIGRNRYPCNIRCTDTKFIPRKVTSGDAFVYEPHGVHALKRRTFGFDPCSYLVLTVLRGGLVSLLLSSPKRIQASKSFEGGSVSKSSFRAASSRRFFSPRYSAAVWTVCAVLYAA